MLDSINKVMAMRNKLWIHDEMNHDKCSHQTYSVDLQQDDDHSHDQVQCGSMMQYMQVSHIENSNHNLGGEVISVLSPKFPGS